MGQELDEVQATVQDMIVRGSQEEAAAMMGVSRKTLWNDLHRVRKKVVNALVSGCVIRIEGGDYVQR